MTRDKMTPETLKDIEESWRLKREAIEILNQVVSEWKTDPMSVQCFDLRTVERAKFVCESLNEITPEWMKK